MRVVILTCTLSGSASIYIPHLVAEPEIEIAMIVYGKRILDPWKLIKSKSKKVMKIGILGFLNGVRIQAWEREGVPKQRIDIQAREFGIRFEETPAINSEETINLLTEAGADLGLSLGNVYIEQRVFSIPKYGTINIHSEVLPQFRGAPSVIWQIYEGSCETGYAIHQIDHRIDHGNILYQEKIPIELKPTLRQTVSHNSERLVRLSALQLVNVVKNYPEFAAKSKPQGQGRYFTTPTLRQYLQIVRQHRRLYQLHIKEYNETAGLQ
ncbi:Methionyl-tRNA formyltransferase [subsurface metagenome]